MTLLTPSTHTHITCRVLSLWCLMEPSYGLLIRRTTVRLIYSTNQALINSRTLVRPPLKLTVITHSKNVQGTNNQKNAQCSLVLYSGFLLAEPRTQNRLCFVTEFSVKEKIHKSSHRMYKSFTQTLFQSCILLGYISQTFDRFMGLKLSEVLVFLQLLTFNPISIQHMDDLSNGALYLTMLQPTTLCQYYTALVYILKN